jgi:hypothetical protein
MLTASRMHFFFSFDPIRMHGTDRWLLPTVAASGKGAWARGAQDVTGFCVLSLSCIYHDRRGLPELAHSLP